MSLENDIDILAKTIYGEARGETELGKKAVASVIMNRFRRRSWFSGKTVAETCTFSVTGSKWHQFSCWNESDPNRQVIEKATPEQLAPYKKLAERYILGLERDVVGGCCHYHAVGVTPNWALGLKPAYMIGKHAFYLGVK